jgi:hypothetical protein
MPKWRVCTVCNVLKICNSLVSGRRACAWCYIKSRPVRFCDECGGTHSVHAHKESGRLLCQWCYVKNFGKRAACTSCGVVAKIPAFGMCRRCYEAAHVRQGQCKHCGLERALVTEKYCHRCRKYRSNCKVRDERLAALFGDVSDRPALRRLLCHLRTERHPENVRQWLATVDHRIVERLRSERGALSESIFIPFRALAGYHFLITSCQRAGIIATAPQIERAEQELEALIANAPPPVGLVLRRYWLWCLKLRVQAPGRRRVDPRLRKYRTLLRSAAAFLTYLSERDLQLADVCQSDLDEYLRTRAPSERKTLQRLIHWASDGGITASPLRVRRADHIEEGMPRASYYALLARMRADKSIPTMLRVALMLVLLTGHYGADVLHVRRAAVSKDRQDIVRVTFRRGQPWAFERELGELLWSMRGSGRGWLFPSPRHRGQPMSSDTLKDHLGHYGIVYHIRQMRGAAIREMVLERGAGEAAYYLGASPEIQAHWRQRYGVSRIEKAAVAGIGTATAPRIGRIGAVQ